MILVFAIPTLSKYYPAVLAGSSKAIQFAAAVMTFRSPFVLCPAVCLCFTVLFLPARVQAQSVDDVHIVPRNQPQPPSIPRQSGPSPAFRLKPVRVDVDVVLVPVTVMDLSNRPVMDLAKQNFTLFEDNTEQRIQYFGSEDAPISVGVLVDLSGSMKNKIDSVRQAVDQFFNNANPDDDYFVVTFADRPALLADTTQSIATIQSKLATMEAGGNTALADAIYMGMLKLRSAKYQRKALVIISDGGDNFSRYNLREVRSFAMESDAQIYAIDVCDALPLFLPAKLSELAEQHWLSQVTDTTGGRTIAVDNAAKIPDAASRISLELRNQYVLGYRPSHAVRDGKWRKIRVRVTYHKNPQPLQVHFKRGYVAPRP
jgi:Ca-activated chloride channel family protein